MAPTATTTRACSSLAGEPFENLERLTQRCLAVLVALHERLGVQGSAERARLILSAGQLNLLGGQRGRPPALRTEAGEAAGSARAPRKQRRIQAAVAGHAEQDNLHATRFVFIMVATRAESIRTLALWNTSRAA